MTLTTPTSAEAWRPDHVAYVQVDGLPNLLLPEVSTIAGNVEGDAVAVRIPYVETDGASAIVAEGAPIAETEPDLSEIVVMTRKVATLTKVSTEQFRQPEARVRLLESLQRSVVRKANAEFVAAVDALSGDFVDGGALGTNLDSLSDAIAEVEANDGAASHIIMPASAWQTLSKIKTGTDSNMPLLGTGANSTEGVRRSVLGIPVHLSAAATSVFVLSKADLLAASGEIAVATSEDAFFASDAMGLRATLRFGIAPSRANRHAVIALD